MTREDKAVERRSRRGVDYVATQSTRVDARGEARTGPRRELVEKQIFAEATRLFAERGFARTTLQDIADATGLTRPALYHYVANKNELLARLVSETTQTPADHLRKINDRLDLRPSEKLRSMATTIALHQARNPNQFQLIVRSEAELPPYLARTFEQGRRQVLKEFIRVIEDGISAGELRPIDSRSAALGIIGMLNWIAWWHQPGNARNDETVAKQLGDMARRSLERGHGSDGPVAEDGPARAIARLREDVDYLERLIAGAGRST